MYDYSFKDEHFDDVVAVLVASAYFEALLWIGLQVCGFKPSPGKKSMPLSQLICKAKEIGLLNDDLINLLKKLNELRNDMAHDVDYILRSEDVDGLETLLPQPKKRRVQAILRNMPDYTAASKLRVVLMEIEALMLGWFEEITELTRSRITERNVGQS